MQRSLRLVSRPVTIEQSKLRAHPMTLDGIFLHATSESALDCASKLYAERSYNPMAYLSRECPNILIASWLLNDLERYRRRIDTTSWPDQIIMSHQLPWSKTYYLQQRASFQELFIYFLNPCLYSAGAKPYGRVLTYQNVLNCMQNLVTWVIGLPLQNRVGRV
jgi:hypothetical protein